MRFRYRWTAVCVIVACAAALTVWAQRHPTPGPVQWSARVVASYPHDPSAFTQGLAVHDGRLFEGTGQYGRSTIREVDLKSGRVLRSVQLNYTYFGEGITIFDERLYQLTWQSETAFVYDLESFELVETLQYGGEGWGLTHDGQALIVSDGSAALSYYDPVSFERLRSVDVHDGEEPVRLLNELEYIDGEIWANIWHEDRLARISPQTGEVLGWVDLSALNPRAQRGSEAVLNGIAYDADAERLFVTGKNWPRLFEIELVRP
jgi:glutamine cyclotransferase